MSIFTKIRDVKTLSQSDLGIKGSAQKKSARATAPKIKPLDAGKLNRARKSGLHIGGKRPSGSASKAAGIVPKKLVRPAVTDDFGNTAGGTSEPAIVALPGTGSVNAPEKALEEKIKALPDDGNPGKSCAKEFIECVLSMVPEKDRASCFGQPKFIEAICRSAQSVNNLAIQGKSIQGEDRNIAFKLIFELDAGSLIDKHSGDSNQDSKGSTSFKSAFFAGFTKKSLAPGDAVPIDINIGKIEALIKALGVEGDRLAAAGAIAASLVSHIIKSKAGYPGGKAPTGSSIQPDVLIGTCLAAISHVAQSPSAVTGLTEQQKKAIIRQAAATGKGNSSEKTFLHYYLAFSGSLSAGRGK